MRIHANLKALMFTVLLLTPLTSKPNTPLQHRSFSCQQLIVFDNHSGKMTGSWAMQLDNLARFHAFEKATAFVGTFYVSTHEEYLNPQRKAQKLQIEKALGTRAIPYGRVEFEVPDSSSFIHRPRGYSLPYAVITASFTFNPLDTREPPKCW